VTSPRAAAGTPAGSGGKSGQGGTGAGALSRALGSREVVIALVLVALVKLVTWAGGYLMAKERLVAFDAGLYAAAFHHQDLDPRLFDPGKVEFFRLWDYSDAEWYLSIAASSYPSREQAVAAHQAPAGEYRSTERENYMRYAFFPLYSLLVAMLAVALPLRMAAFLVTLVASVAAAIAAVLLFDRTFPSEQQRSPLALALLLTFPFAVFYSLYFPEALFLLLSLLVFYGLRTGSWPLVGVAGFLLSLTRPNGVFIVLPVLWVVWREAGKRGGRRGSDAAPLAWTALIPAGMVAFMAYNYARIGDPVFFHTVQYKWRNVTADPLGNLWRNTVERLIDFFALDFHSFHSSQLDVVVMVAFAALLVAMWRERSFPRELTVWAALLWAVPLVSKDLMSFSRYMAVSFPAFFYLARARSRWLPRAALAVFVVGYLFAVAGVIAYHWVG
jgi:hypothetical protein